MKRRSHRRHRRQQQQQQKKGATPPHSSLVQLSDADIAMLTKKDNVAVYEDVVDKQKYTYNTDELYTGLMNLRWDFEDAYNEDRTRTDEAIRRQLRDRDKRYDTLATNYKHMFHIFTSRASHHRQLDLVLFMNEVDGRVKQGRISAKMAYEICVARQNEVLGKLQVSFNKRLAEQEAAKAGADVGSGADAGSGPDVSGAHAMVAMSNCLDTLQQTTGRLGHGRT